jgi:hypothetical protein
MEDDVGHWQRDDLEFGERKVIDWGSSRQLGEEVMSVSK